MLSIISNDDLGSIAANMIHEHNRSSGIKDITSEPKITIRISHIVTNEDASLADIIRGDKSVMMFLKVTTGVSLINDNNASVLVNVLARSWMAVLLVLAAIGFCWQVFVGTYYISLLNKQTSLSNNDDVKPVNIFISVGFVFRDFIVPLLQASSLMYSMFIISKQLRQTFNSTVVSKLLGPCKRDTIIFFIAMMLLVIIINPLIINPTEYEAKFLDIDDDSVKKDLELNPINYMPFGTRLFCSTIWQ